MRVRSAPLEDWLRDYYFAAKIDISSSGVYPYSMAELREKTGVVLDDIDSLVFNDGYSLGSPQVRSAIAQRCGGIDPAKVMTTNGSSEAISLVLMALLRPGDEVVVVQPGYHLLVDLAAALECQTKVWHLDAGADWAVSFDELAEIVTERTRAIVVNFPHNPTGATITEHELGLLLRQAERVGAYLLWDAAFTDMTYETAPLPEVSARYERAISFGTFSKAFGLPGLRFGWCAAPPAVLSECVRIKDYTTLHVSPLIEMLACRVLTEADSFLGPRLSEARVNRMLLQEWAESEADRVSLSLPAGGVAAFPRFTELESTDELCEQLFRQHGVLVVPGSCFGCPQHIRLGFGGPGSEFARGLNIVSSTLDGRRAPRASGRD